MQQCRTTFDDMGGEEEDINPEQNQLQLPSGSGSYNILFLFELIMCSKVLFIQTTDFLSSGL